VTLQGSWDVADVVVLRAPVIAIALGLAALMVFLILAAQYDRWSLPLAVMLALPFGTFGALAAIGINNLLPLPFYLAQGVPWLQWLLSPLAGIARLSNDVYFQIGLVTLLGLAAKNAILIVEYAVLKKGEGFTTSAAAIEAARLRFRPIIMTSMAFIGGVAPLVVASGAGAAGRHSIGTGVFGGMLGATFLAIFFVPLFFVLVRGFSRRPLGAGAVPVPAPSEDEKEPQHA